MISYPRKLVYYCRFDPDFILIANLFNFQNDLKSLPLNIWNWLRKAFLMPNRLPSHSVIHVRWMSIVRNRSTRNMLFCIELVYFWFTDDMVFALYFFISLMCVWLKNIYCIDYLYTSTSQSHCFAVSINFCK